MSMNILKQDTLVHQGITVSFVTKPVQLEMHLEFTMFAITVTKNKNYFIELCLELDLAINNSLLKTEDGWLCTICQHTTKFKQRAWEHVESKHMNTGGYICVLCQKHCPTASSLRHHNDRHHKVKGFH